MQPSCILLFSVFFLRTGHQKNIPCLSPHAVNTTQYKETLGFPSGSVVKNLPADAGDSNLIPGWGRSFGVENGNPLQYSCLKSPMDRGAQWAIACGVAELNMIEGLSTHTHTHTHTLFHTHTHSHTHIHVHVSLKFVLYTICENEILTSKMSQALLVMMIALELGTQSPK